jgi:hypothetical protein
MIWGVRRNQLGETAGMLVCGFKKRSSRNYMIKASEPPALLETPREAFNGATSGAVSADL